jgi:heterodisulfide reductase subunit A
VDFATDGIFLAGLAHFPKPIEEAITEAQAAVARAVTVLADRRVELDSNKARLDLAKCDHCALCVDVCPYQAIHLEPMPEDEEKQHVVVNEAKCKGCGICQATCPKDGINVGGFSYRQLSAQVEAAMK